ncbi:MAG: O-antigen ligase family protein [bacterium]|nr:O-antigen ligase family protein [bacterium]
MSSHTLRRIIVWLGYTASFAPLILFRNFYFPFIVPKTVFFRTVVELMFVLWVVLALKYPQYRPRLHSKVTWGFGAFLFFVLISAVAGLDPRMSFWGDFERMWGFLTLAHFFAFFLVLSTTYDTKDWLRLFQVNLAVGSLVALYGIAQRLNFPFVEQPGLDRIIATLGNASYVGAYMILMGASALYLFVVRPVTERWWYALAGLLAATALVLSVTRGAYLGALTGVGLLLAAVTYLAKDGRVRRWLFVLTAGAVVAALLLILFRTGPVIQGNRYLRRLTEFDLSSNTAQTRFIGWRAALNGFYERPLFGWGEENYIVAFNKSFTARFYSLAPTETYFDRAHNQFLDTLVSEGIFGFLSYVSIYIFTILGAVGLWRRSALDSATFLLLVITPVAYAVQDFFVFDTLGPFMLLLILFGFGEHILRKSAAGAVPVSEQDPERKRKSAPSRSVAVTPQHAVVRPKKEERLMTMMIKRMLGNGRLFTYQARYKTDDLFAPHDIRALKTSRKFSSDSPTLRYNNRHTPCVASAIFYRSLSCAKNGYEIAPGPLFRPLPHRP